MFSLAGEDGCDSSSLDGDFFDFFGDLEKKFIGMTDEASDSGTVLVRPRRSGSVAEGSSKMQRRRPVSRR